MLFKKHSTKVENTARLPEELIHHIASYIDLHYIGGARQTAKKHNVHETIAASCDCSPPPMPCMVEAARPLTLEDMLKQEDAGFTETLLKLIDRSGKKDSAVYKKANLSKQHFSKIRNDPHYKPKKATAVALALALELDLDETRDLIGRAGYALTCSSKFDLIIRFFIEQRNYDVVQINMALYEFDQPLLGT